MAGSVIQSPTCRIFVLRRRRDESLTAESAAWARAGTSRLVPADLHRLPLGDYVRAEVPRGNSTARGD